MKVTFPGAPLPTANMHLFTILKKMEKSLSVLNARNIIAYSAAVIGMTKSHVRSIRKVKTQIKLSKPFWNLFEEPNSNNVLNAESGLKEYRAVIT